MSSPRPSHLSQVDLQQETVRWNASSHFQDALALENCRPMPEGDTVQPRGVGLEGWRVLRNHGQSRRIFALLPYFMRGDGFWKIFWALIILFFFGGGVISVAFCTWNGPFVTMVDVYMFGVLITCYLHEIGTVAVGPKTRVIRTLIRVLLNHETSPQHCWWLTVGWGRRIQLI